MLRMLKPYSTRVTAREARQVSDSTDFIELKTMVLVDMVLVFCKSNV